MTYPTFDTSHQPFTSQPLSASATSPANIGIPSTITVDITEWALASVA